MTLVKIKDLCKTYPHSPNRAINNLSLEFAKGEIITLLGPSGCGKTTTLRLIAGFERPDSGTIWLNNKIVAGDRVFLPPEHRGIGMVFQDYALFPHVTVAENVAFPLKKTSGANVKARVAEVLSMVGLTALKDRFPHQLSGGQQQRVALARALSANPELILLDEPFSNLDAGLKERMRAEVRQIIKNTGTTAVFVTHDQRDALAISDVIAVMKEGGLEQVGTPREVYQFPASRFVAELTGQANIVDGMIPPWQGEVVTPLGQIPCKRPANLAAGTKVHVSIRPEGFLLDPGGAIKGQFVSATYVGSAVEAEILVDNCSGVFRLKVHLHSAMQVATGQLLAFKVLPDFVAVIP